MISRLSACKSNLETMDAYCIAFSIALQFRSLELIWILKVVWTHTFEAFNSVYVNSMTLFQSIPILIVMLRCLGWLEGDCYLYFHLNLGLDVEFGCNKFGFSIEFEHFSD